MRPQGRVSDSPTSSNTSTKRKLHETRNESNVSAVTGTLIDNQSSDPPPKKSKTSPSSPLITHFGRSQTIMSKTMGMPRPQVTDPKPSKASNFQPHTGAKKLVIKNLRMSSRHDAEEYYKKTWEELDDALTSVFVGKQPKAPLEVLYRGVEATCRRGRALDLYKNLKARCKTHIQTALLSRRLSGHAGLEPVEALKAVERIWMIWRDQLALIRSIFSFLDRSFLLNSKDHRQLEDMGIRQFRKNIFMKRSVISSLGSKVISGICELVRFDREGLSSHDPVLLRASIATLHILGIYAPLFEETFQEISANYLEQYALENSSSALSSYIVACDNALQRESIRCDTYNFDSITKKTLLEAAHNILITERSECLLDSDAISKLLDANAMASLKSLYQLLSLSKIQLKLKKPFESYIKAVGMDIAMDKEKGDEMVVRLLELKRSLDTVIRDAFNKDEKFTYCLRDAFGSFINDRQVSRAWGSETSKVGEMIAKYIDTLLRGGLRAVPRSLISDATDREVAEKAGQASTGDEDAELDRQLDQGLELFRFIEGKDVFEAFYKKDLARRLLMARSASQDAERNMIAKLRVECGNSFTHNLEQMFKDQELAREEMIAYKESLSNTSKTTLDLQVSVLSASAWPTYPDIKVNLPSEVAKHIEKYDRHYKHKHTGRRLVWKHTLAHSVVRATFNKGTKELLVSAFQAIVLVLFNELSDPTTGHLSFTDISTATGLPDAELERTLQSLACAKSRVLTKHPKGREIIHTDTFTINLGFTDPKFRIKINQIQLKETKEENKETHERVAQDRQYETQAAIVRIMKSRKKMTHQALMTEVINQTKGRGAVEPVEIKKNIEKLIEKEYIEREDGLYAYMA